MIQIITDSTADLPENLLKKYNIHVVPLTIHIGGQEYKEGEISTKNFAQKMAASKTLPKTSQPSPASFAKVFRKLAPHGELICITLSSKLSGTYQSACLAKKLSGVDVAIFDSLASTLAQGLYVIKAAEMAEEGFSRSEIIKELEQYRDQMSIYVILNTLEYAVKGGQTEQVSGSPDKNTEYQGSVRSN